MIEQRDLGRLLTLHNAAALGLATWLALLALHARSPVVQADRLNVHSLASLRIVGGPSPMNPAQISAAPLGNAGTATPRQD